MVKVSEFGRSRKVRAVMVSMVVGGCCVGRYVCSADLGEFPVRRGAGCVVEGSSRRVDGLLRRVAVERLAAERGKVLGEGTA